MNKPTVYTPLESLFLFQSLLTHGVDTNAFLRISDLLKNNALIKGGATYDAARFTPEALQQLFLLLLGEELKSESERQDVSDGVTVPSQKKRKVGSPPLPTLKDAGQHMDKVPDLVDRLYARYRDHAIKEIREDERKFEAVQKDIQLLERSEKERLARSASQNGTPVLAPRENKGIGSNSPSPSPGPTGVLAGMKRGPPGSVPSPGATTPAHLLPRTSASPISQNEAIVPPPGVAQNVKANAGKPVLSPRPEGVDGQIKWERPYSPQAGNQPIQPAPVPGQRGVAGQLPPGAQARPIPGKTQAGGPVPIQAKPPHAAHGRAIQPTPIPDAVRAALSPSPNQPSSPVEAPTATPKAGLSKVPNLPPPSDSQASPYGANQPRPAIPEHMIRQVASTPTPTKRAQPTASSPQTPAPSSPAGALTRGFGTKWATQSTPSTPGPIIEEPESPAFEPVSPPQRQGPFRASSRSAATKESPKGKGGRGRPSRSSLRGRGFSTTRSPSATPQPEDSKRIKRERMTPKPHDDAGDTTADESIAGRTRRGTPGGRTQKRKRNETPLEPLEPTAPQTHVLWTRGFTKVSSSALDQISSHRDANMFATALRERDAPNYRQVVLHPQDITSIRAAIKHGNKAATQAAANLHDGDPGTPSVWLPVDEELQPPSSIINSAQLERELVHMFGNAIMYNPDPDRGFGPAFVKRSHDDDEEEALGYEMDENGVVRNTQGMFLEVEKLLTELRSAERDREPPLPTVAVTAAEDTAEEEEEESAAPKRRRVSARH